DLNPQRVLVAELRAPTAAQPLGVLNDEGVYEHFLAGPGNIAKSHKKSDLSFVMKTENAVTRIAPARGFVNIEAANSKRDSIFRGNMIRFS
ncbi:MAG: hypothetical protein II634_06120, partial [Lachnospiraceae bacterium]|nr:hypothetical protein [Lachnospiraceae bacterium]